VLTSLRSEYAKAIRDIGLLRLKGNVVSTNAEALRPVLAALRPEDRAELAYFLLDTLNGNEHVDWEAAWVAELDKRASEVRNGTVSLEPADRVFAEFREKDAFRKNRVIE
jgi:hypothetical protein